MEPETNTSLKGWLMKLSPNNKFVRFVFWAGMPEQTSVCEIAWKTFLTLILCFLMIIVMPTLILLLVGMLAGLLFFFVEMGVVIVTGSELSVRNGFTTYLTCLAMTASAFGVSLFWKNIKDLLSVVLSPISSWLEKKLCVPIEIG